MYFLDGRASFPVNGVSYQFKHMSCESTISRFLAIPSGSFHFYGLITILSSDADFLQKHSNTCNNLAFIQQQDLNLSSSSIKALK